MIRTLTLLILTAIVIASVACGSSPPPEVIIVTATPPPTPSSQDIEDVLMLQKQVIANFESGNDAKAIELASQAIELWPDNSALHMTRGWAYERSGNIPEACKDYRIAFESDVLLYQSEEAFMKLAKQMDLNSC